MIERGVPARELSDSELERQGAQAHLTRNRIFLHGTAEQFRHHTERMLELEQEYLRRHPKRTWQGTADVGGVDLAGMDRLSQIRLAFRAFVDQMNALLAEPEDAAPAGLQPEHARLLAAFAAAPDGRLHKLEAHQAAREAGLTQAQVAMLYKQDPPLLVAAGTHRVISEDGRAWLAAQD